MTTDDRDKRISEIEAHVWDLQPTVKHALKESVEAVDWLLAALREEEAKSAELQSKSKERLEALDQLTWVNGKWCAACGQDKPEHYPGCRIAKAIEE